MGEMKVNDIGTQQTAYKLLKIVNRYNVHVDILLKPSIGIVSLN